MKLPYSRLLILFIILITAALPSVAAQAAGFGQARLWNDGWEFALQDSMPAAEAAWTKVKLPHDWSIRAIPSPTLNSCTGYLPGGIGWYRKHFVTPAGVSTADAAEAGASLRRLFVYFEGIYNRSDVYLNGHRIGGRPNGYVSTLYELTPWLRPEGEVNELTVRVDHSRQADSRYYTGSGIYRDVYLVEANPTRFGLWGLSWQADVVPERDAMLSIFAETVSPDGKSLTVKARLIDGKGRVVGRAAGKVIPGEKSALKMKVKQPQLWSPDSPALYRLEADLISDGLSVDHASSPVGFRSLRFDADKGFFLNGKNLKIKGVCLHHDAGALGAEVPRAVWRTRLEALKHLGANAVRMSHNPQAPMVYDLCDSLGLMVMDEASDEWEFPKRKWLKGWNVGTPGYEGSCDFFEEWIDRDVADMVRRDRCHPSVILWSIGNEVDYPNDPYSHPVLDGDDSAIAQPMYGGYNPQAPRAERIGTIAGRLAKVVRSHDSSRPVTGALAGVVMSNQTSYPQAVDVVGYNYTEGRYEQDHAAYPGRVIYGSETHQSYEAWRAVTDHDFIAGQFIWTGADYLGESGHWPSRGLGTGLLGFDNRPKSRGLFREALWADHPVAYLTAYAPMRSWTPQGVWMDAPRHWNYDPSDFLPGDSVTVQAFTNAASAQLKLNGDAIGRCDFDDSIGGIVWRLPYRPGVLTLEAFDSGGALVATDTLRTVGLPAALRARVADTRDGLIQMVVEVVDADGHIVPQADNDLQVIARGGRILALESSDNADMSPSALAEPESAFASANGISAAHRRAHDGRLLVYILPDSKAKGSTDSNANGPADASVKPVDTVSHTLEVSVTSPMLRKATLKLPL